MVNVVTRSGTNSSMATRFLFIRNNYLDATSFGVRVTLRPGYGTNPSCARTLFTSDQYGGTIGGPVWFPKLYNGKDKLFFFAGFQYSSYKQASSTTYAYVPTAANLLGNFTSAAPPTRPGTEPRELRATDPSAARRSHSWWTRLPAPSYRGTSTRHPRPGIRNR